MTSSVVSILKTTVTLSLAITSFSREETSQMRSAQHCLFTKATLLSYESLENYSLTGWQLLCCDMDYMETEANKPGLAFPYTNAKQH